LEQLNHSSRPCQSKKEQQILPGVSINKRTFQVCGSAVAQAFEVMAAQQKLTAILPAAARLITW
jgi:hypothetical protein